MTKSKFFLALIAIVSYMALCVWLTVYVGWFAGMAATLSLAYFLIKFFDAIERPQPKRNENPKTTPAN